MPRLTTLSTLARFAALLSLAGCASERSAAAAPPPAQAAPVAVLPSAAVEATVDPRARGAQLVQIGGCGDCHTPMRFDEQLQMPLPDQSRRLSGHPEGGPEPKGQPGVGDQGVIGATFTSFGLPFGVVYAANLTPDPDTGLGRWTAEDFIATMRTGHEKGQGRALMPPMPWQNLSQQPEQDLRAIFAYLQSLPPIHNRVPGPKVPPEVMDGISKSYHALTLAKR